jgi:hypothetical protein
MEGERQKRICKWFEILYAEKQREDLEVTASAVQMPHDIRRPA